MTCRRISRDGTHGKRLKPVGLHADAPKNSRRGEAKAQTFGGERDLEAARPKSPKPDAHPTPSPDLAPPPRGSIGSAAAGDLGTGRSRRSLGWAGGNRGAMASAQAPSYAAAPSRKDHLEAGKKRVGPLLPVACEKCSPCVPAIADWAICYERCRQIRGILSISAMTGVPFNRFCTG